MKNVPNDLNNSKNKVDKVDVDKLVAAPVDLSKLSDVVECDVVKKETELPMLLLLLLKIKYLILVI